MKELMKVGETGLLPEARGWIDTARPMVTWLRYRQNTLLLLLLAAYWIFNHGFMLLRVEGAGVMVPVGEGVLLLSLIVLNHRRVLTRLRAVMPLTPLLVWWVIGGVHIAWGFVQHGGIALRDASHMIDSLFLLVGIQFALMPGAVERLFRWLPWIFAGCFVHAMLYPFRDALEPWLPTVQDTYGGSVPMFLSYVTTPMLLIMAVAYLLLMRFKTASRPRKLGIVAVASLLLTLALVLFQSRLIMLQAGFVLLLFVLVRRDLILPYAVALLLVLGAVAALDVTNVPIHGRQTTQASLHFFVGHAMTIVGVDPEEAPHAEAEPSPPAVGTAADEVQYRLDASYDGWSWRFDLWRQFFDNWTRDLPTIALGMGYGEPVVHRPANHFVVREPHNGYFSVLAKTGLVGMSMWLWFHLAMLRAGGRTLLRHRAADDAVQANRLLALFVFACLIAIHALVQDTFTKPFFVAPYYLLWGIVLGGMVLHRRGASPSVAA